LIFGPELARLVMAGLKTETRRLVKGDPETAVCRYKEGRTYAVRPERTRGSIGRIKILSVRRERLGDIDHAGARLEGFPNVGRYLDYWRTLHGHVDPDAEVWAIRFELVRPAPHEEGEG